VKSQQHQENRARKSLRTITLILGAFVFCWTPWHILLYSLPLPVPSLTPWHILSLVIGFCAGSESCGVPSVLYDLSYWLCYLNSPINPFCYALANDQFKKAFVRILRLDWRRG